MAWLNIILFLLDMILAFAKAFYNENIFIHNKVYDYI